MLICREYKNCADIDMRDCFHRKPHTPEEVEMEDESPCTLHPCICKWAEENNLKPFCVDQFVMLMEKAIDR